MRERWIERVTGNSYWNGAHTDKGYQEIVDGFSKRADEILPLFIPDNEQILFSDLNLQQPENMLSTDTNDSFDFDVAFDRICKLAVAWAAKGSSYFQNEELKNKVLYALEWCCDHFYNEHCSYAEMFGNWWHWWIGIPRNLGTAAILMHDVLPAPLAKKLAAALRHFNRDPLYVYLNAGVGGHTKLMTSGNLADTCLISVLRGAAFDDAEVLRNGTKYMREMASTVTEGEGFYPDGSFIQHTNLAYTGGYGATLLNGVEQLFYLTDSTPYQIPDEQKQPVFDWIWNGVRPMYANGAMFDMVSGRGVTRPGNSDYVIAKGILQVMLLLADSAPAGMRQPLKAFCKAQLQAAVQVFGESSYFSGMTAAAMMCAKKLMQDTSVIAKANDDYAKMFGSMDKAVAHNRRFSFGVSMASTRTGRFEYGNHENKKGWHQSDGVTYIYNGDGQQYADNYWNTVDPHRLAGITTDHSTCPLVDWVNPLGASACTGGTALGADAVFAMEFAACPDSDNPHLYAKKAWFVLNGRIVALGADIRGICPERITETIVENKKLSHKAENRLLLNGHPADLCPSFAENLALQWAWLEGNTAADAMGYYFLQPTTVAVKREKRVGSWYSVNGISGVSDQPVNREYFSIAIPHNTCTQPESYAYLLLPSVSESEMQTFVRQNPVCILANTSQVQAAADCETQTMGVQLWQAGEWKLPQVMCGVSSISADRAVSLLLHREGDALRIALADPTQNAASVTVHIQGEWKSVSKADEKIKISADDSGLTITANTENMQGMTVQAVLCV